MREILFKAKQKSHENDNWFYGSYYKTDDTTYCFAQDYVNNPNNRKYYILFDRMIDWGLPNEKLKVEIDPSTLCQYTGRLDINGNKIFEGDIVELIGKNNEKFTFIVVYDYLECGFRLYKGKKYHHYDKTYRMNDYKIKVVGNIFDKEWEGYKDSYSDRDI